tara:strand:+ start:109 stop:432 length:324 start_codon:yes stop_codon:yes gene_type:complete
MDILKILSTFYSEHEWVVKNNNYEDLFWSDSNLIAKPSLEELQDKWDNQTAEINNRDVQVQRQKAILSQWPMEKQFEAITEHHMGRSDRLDELTDFIEQVKAQYPKH